MQFVADEAGEFDAQVTPVEVAVEVEQVDFEQPVAAGDGRATTYTVVECVVAIVVADLVFTAIFFALGLF